MTEHLVIQVLRGRASQVDRMQVEKWRAASSENERRFQEISALWRASRKLGGGWAFGPQPSSTGIVLAAKTRRMRRLYRVAMAAGLAAAAIGVGWFATQHMTGEPTLTLTADVRPRTITLQDGSIVRLDAGASMAYYDRPTRRVALEGRAFFAIVSDSTRPFAVTVRDASITVLGTRFDVNPRGDSVYVAVAEGRVSLANGGAVRELIAGQTAIAHDDGITGSTRTAFDALDWDPPFFFFQDTPVFQVARELAARLGTQIVVADSVVGRRPVTARFEDTSITEILETICLTTAARCETLNGITRIGR